MASVDVTGTGGTGGNIFVSGAYLSAYDLEAQGITAPYQIQQLKYDFVDFSSAVSIGGINNTDIVFAGPGIYNIMFSVQVTCNLPQAQLFYLWLCLNGSPVANTNSVLTIHGTHGGNKGHSIAAWDFMVSANTGDAYQLCWTANNVAVAIETVAPPAPGIPVSPTVILSVTQS